MAAYYEEIWTYNRSCVWKPRVWDGNINSFPNQWIDIKHPHVTKALPSIRTAEYDEFAANHVCGMVTTRFRFRLGNAFGFFLFFLVARWRYSRSWYELPAHFIDVCNVQSPNIVEGSNTIAATKDINAIAVKSMRYGLSAYWVACRSLLALTNGNWQCQGHKHHCSMPVRRLRQRWPFSSQPLYMSLLLTKEVSRQQRKDKTNKKHRHQKT